MPLNRTPPPVTTSPTGLGHTASVPLLLHSTSEPSLTAEINPEFGTPRGTTPTHAFRNFKRKRDEADDATLVTFMSDIKKIMVDFQEQQNSKYEKLFAVVEEFRIAVDFFVQKNESLQTQVNKLETDRTANLEYITALETKVENFERCARSTCLEIRNILSSQSETKSALVSNVIQIGKVLNVPMQASEVKDVFRIKTKDPANKTIIVDFASVLLKERFVTSYKKCNREKNRLTTEKLRLAGPPKPIFISENLSAKLKKLFYLAREHAKANDFQFCWVSGGKIFLRKREGGSLVRVSNEADLSNMSCNK